MKRLFFYISLMVLSMTSGYGQSWEWGVMSKSINQNPERYAMAVDQEGNSYIAGYFQQDLTMGAFSISSNESSYSDIFLTKVDVNGKVKWLKMLDNVDTYSTGIGICLNDNRSFYLTGSVNGRIIVAKYDTTGTMKWANNFNNRYYGYGNSVAVDQAENVYIAGTNGGNGFIGKVSAEGKTIWVNIINGRTSNDCKGSDIAVDESGNAYVAGSFSSDSIRLGNTTLKYFGGSWGVIPFLTKLDKNGNYVWAKSGTGGQSFSSPQVALSDDNFLYFTGDFFFENIIFDTIKLTKTATANKASPYLVKYNQNGKVEWARVANTYKSGPTIFDGGLGTPKDIRVDLDNNIYLTGSFFTCYGCTENDLYVEKYDKNGTFRWSRTIASPRSETSFAIDIDNKGNIYHAGNFAGLEFVGGQESATSSVGCAKIISGQTTRLRPYKPDIQSVIRICNNEQNTKLEATGNNIKWYASARKDKLLLTGNVYQNTFTKTDTVYVTQTTNGIESWAKPVVIFVSKLKDLTLKKQGDTLTVDKLEGVKYNWYRDGKILKYTGNTCIIDSLGVYSITVSDDFCSKTASINLILSVSEEQNPLTIFPNPAFDSIEIRNLDLSNSPKSYSISDLLGKELRSSIITNNTQAIQIHDLPAGSYLLRIMDTNAVKYFRLIKQ